MTVMLTAIGILFLWAALLLAIPVLVGLVLWILWVRWLRGPRKCCGIAFDVAGLGTNVRVRPVARRPRVGRSAVSESKRLERLLEARAYIAGLGYFADR